MRAIALLIGAVLAGGPRPPSDAADAADAAADERRLVLDQRQGKRLELVRTAPAQTTPPMEGTLEVVEAGGARRAILDRVGAAAFTPDGGVLAIRRGRLLRLDAQGRALAELARGLAPELEMDPSGSRVALVRPRPQGGTTIEVLELSGGDPRPVTVVSGGGTNNAPAFTPDGSSLLFVSTRTGVSSVFRVGLDGGSGAGGDERQLTNRGLAAAAGPRFVPPPERTTARRFEGGRLTWVADGARWVLDPATEVSGRLEGGAR